MQQQQPCVPEVLYRNRTFALLSLLIALRDHNSLDCYLIAPEYIFNLLN